MHRKAHWERIYSTKGEGGTGQIFAFKVKSGKIERLGEIVDGALK